MLRAGEMGLNMLAAMEIVAYPAVDTLSPLTAICNCSPFVRTSGFWDRTKRTMPELEGKILGQRTDQCAVGQLDAQILLDVLRELVGGRKILLAVLGRRVVCKGEVPPEFERVNQGIFIEIIPENSFPRPEINLSVPDDFSGSIHIWFAKCVNLDHSVNKPIDECRT